MLITILGPHWLTIRFVGTMLGEGFARKQSWSSTVNTAIGEVLNSKVSGKQRLKLGPHWLAL